MVYGSLKEVVVGVVIYLANINQLKVFEEIFPKYEKYSIRICFSFAVLVI